MTGEVTITLGKPIQAHGEELRQMVLRRPTGVEMRKCGAVYRVNTSDGSVVYDPAAVSAMIVLICGIPMSSVDQMDGADWQEAADVLAGFTAAKIRKPSSPDTTTPGASGATAPSSSA